MLRCKDLSAELDAYLDGELEEERAAEVAGHVEECAACREALDERRGVALAVKRLPGVKAPAEFVDKFRAAREAGPPMARFDAPRRRRRLAWMAGSTAAAAAALLIAAALIPGTLAPHKSFDVENEAPRAAGGAPPEFAQRGKKHEKHSAAEGGRSPAPKPPDVCAVPKTSVGGGAPIMVVPKLQPGLLKSKPSGPEPTLVPVPSVAEPTRLDQIQDVSPTRTQSPPGSTGSPVTAKSGRRSAGKESNVRVYFLAEEALGAGKEPTESYKGKGGKRGKLAWSRGLNLRKESPATAKVRLARIARSLGGGQVVDLSALRPKGGAATGGGLSSAPAGGAKKTPPKVAASPGTQPPGKSSGFGIMSVEPGKKEKPTRKPKTITAKNDVDDKGAAAAGILVLYLPEDKFETFTRALAAWSGAAPEADGKLGAVAERKALDQLKSAKYLEATDAMRRALKLPKRKTEGGKRYVLVIVRLGGEAAPAAKPKK